MRKIYITIGLPASGKTTWAKEFQSENTHTKRINKDDLRSMIDNGVWSKTKEVLIVNTRDLLLREFLKEGFDVIIDDTNFEPKHREAIEEIAKDFKARVIIKDFTNTSLRVCLERNEKRGLKVPQSAIREMYNRYVKKTAVKFIDPKKKNCIIFDIDGTLAHMVNRSPFEYEKCIYDELDETMYFFNKLIEGLVDIDIIICTGREDAKTNIGKVSELTIKWLKEKDVHFDRFYIREEGDRREDSVVKKEMMDRIKETYNIFCVFDDRNQVVDMWRDNGIKCLQVGEGDF